MPRRPSVRWFETRKAYYCQHKKKQYRLGDGPDDFPDGPNYKAAIQAWLAILNLDHAGERKDRNTFRVVAELYLQHIETRRRASTLRIKKRYLQIACETFGEDEVSSMTTFKVLAWADAQRQRPGNKRWNDGSVSICLAAIHSALRWGARSGLLTKNPLEGIEMPPVHSRGAKAVLADAVRATVIESASRWLRPVLIVMDGTGCRPGEVAAMTAANFDPRINAMVFASEDSRQEGDFAHKTSKKGKTRRIYLSGKALETVQEYMKKHPRGPIFRTQRKTGWNPMCIARALSIIKDKLGLDYLVPYCFRHTYATRWILSGRSIELLASLLGNSAQTIRKHYNHVIEETAGLQNLAEAFNSERETAAEGADILPGPSPTREQIA